MAIPTAAALHPRCHRCHLPRPQPRLPDRPADPIRPPKVVAAGYCGPCPPACVAGLPRAVVGQAESTVAGGCTSSPPCRPFTSLQHRAAGAAYAADTGRHGQAASERHQPGCNCVWVRAGPGAAPPPLVVGWPLARPLPMAGVGFPLPSLFFAREAQGRRRGIDSCPFLNDRWDRLEPVDPHVSQPGDAAVFMSSGGSSFWYRVK